MKAFYKILRSRRDRLKEHIRVLRFLLGMVIPIIARARARPVLFYRYVGMGDIINTFPTVELLKERHSGRTFIYSCYPEFTCLPKMAGITNNVVSVRVEIVKVFWSWLFEKIYIFEHDSWIDSKEPGIEERETSVIEDFGQQHGIVVCNEHPLLQVSLTKMAKMKLLLEKKQVEEGPLIVIHCGPSWRVREFPEKSWAELLNGLRAQGFANIIQVGTSDHSCLGVVGSMVFPEIVSLVDQLSLEESAALISMAQLFVGIDSGLLHVAASLRTPGVGIFGATSPQYRFSQTGSCQFVFSEIECQGCHHRLPRLHYESGCPSNIACMTTLSVEKVLMVCLSQLNTSEKN